MTAAPPCGSSLAAHLLGSQLLELTDGARRDAQREAASLPRRARDLDVAAKQARETPR
jgi:hypothetical protein